jgi:acetyl-CoA carboxylase carboxyl transferase subunit alpha
MFVLPFEKPIVELVEKVKALRSLAAADQRFEPELLRLEEKTSRLAREIFADLSPIQKVQLSRHASRPYTLDYIKRLFTGWIELKGDRRFADDCAIVAGLASYHGRSVVIVGHQKGRGTKENLKRNFGMPNPEGYRKAIRLYELADKFGLPVLTFIDTPGAYPGIGAEERGQSEAIGAALAAMARARVPIIATIIGEGGSGGALALGVANSVLVLEFGCYSVISPEGCAAILWNDASRPKKRRGSSRSRRPSCCILVWSIRSSKSRRVVRIKITTKRPRSSMRHFGQRSRHSMVCPRTISSSIDIVVSARLVLHKR